MFFLLTCAASLRLCTGQEEKNFVGWMKETNRIFVGEEYSFRLGVWLTNKRRIDDHNRVFDKKGYKLGINHFSHLTNTEYKSLLGAKMEPIQKVEEEQHNDDLKSPGPVDYRTLNVVNQIQNQNNCGACWAFGIVAAEESNYALRTDKLLKMSEQNLVDCCSCSFGCNGGLLQMSMMYIINNQGGKFMLEDDYPYKSQCGVCNFDSSKAVGSLVNTISVTSGSESDLARKISEIGVCAAIIDASHFSFQMYSSGIYCESSCSQNNLDHCINVVGFGEDYWIIRNSWGANWGEQGYMRMARNKNNMCGIATMAVFPIV